METPDWNKRQAPTDSVLALQAVIGHSPMAIVAIDLNRNVTLWNPAAERMFGWTESEVIGCPYPAVPDSDQEAYRKQVEAEHAGQSFTDLEVQRQRKDGSMFPARLSVAPLKDESGMIVGSVSILADITDQKRAEKALRESEERFRALVEYAPEAITMLDVDTGLYLDANPMAEALHGLPRDELIGKLGPADLSPEIQLDGCPSSEAAPGYLSRALAGEFPRFEWMHLDPDGQETLCEVSLARLPDPHRKLVRASIFDITERKAAEEALRESEARLSKAAKMAKIGYWVWDEIEDMAVYCSDELAKIYGVNSGAELAALTSSHAADLDWVHPEDRERVERAMKTAKERKCGFEIEHKIINSNGEVRNLHVIEEPVFDEQGQLVRSSGTTQDITELKQAEEEIRKLNAELEQRVEERTAELRTAQADLLRQARMATLGQLTTTVSHELRNPLGVIGTSAFIVNDNLRDGDPRIRRALDRIQRSVIRCDRIIDELLDFTRITEIEAEPAAIDAWLEETLNERALPSGIALRRDFGMPDTTISFDHDRFRRAIINVFDNACQAMIGEGREDTGSEEHTLTVRTREQNGRVEVIFEDTGPGIPPDVYEKIFEPLYSTKGFGVGLGLPVVKQIMERHGGGIEIESEEGRGTQVCLWLPTSYSTQ